MSRRTFKRVFDQSEFSSGLEIPAIDVGAHSIPSLSPRKVSDRQNPSKVKAKETVLKDLGSKMLVHAERLQPQSKHDRGDAAAPQMNPYNTRPVGEDKLSPPRTRRVGLSTRENSQVISPSKIAPTSGRQRRRGNVRRGGSALSGLQPVSIHKYRPDYTWNRGGRVKELRIRTIGRKFLHIWIRNVFGRLNPSIARSHYEHKIVRATFKEWYDLWWTNRHEWRLMVRAECQHRYALWTRVFQAWRTYVIRQRVKTSKLTLADSHAKACLLKRTLSGWMNKHGEIRERRQMNSQAELFKQIQLLRRAWWSWQEQLKLRGHRQHMEVVSLQFWAYRIQVEHWLIWCQAYQLRLEERQKLEEASGHHNNRLVATCFAALLNYTESRRFKQQQKRFAEKIAWDNLTSRCFTHWLEGWQMRRSMALHQENIARLAHTCLLRRSFVHWKVFIVLRQRRCEQEERADLHYLTHLLLLGLSGLRLAVVQRRLKGMRTRMAHDLQHQQLMRRSWHMWMGRCDNNEELKIRPLTKRAQQHFSLVIVRKTWTKLVQYTQWRQYRQAQYVKADASHYLRSLPKFFFRMKVYVQMMKNRRENELQTQLFRRENLQARFFYHWYEESEKSQNYRMAERMAILHYDGNVERHFLALWRYKTREVLEEREKEYVADEHNCQRICKQTMSLWRSYVQQLGKSEEENLRATRHHYLQLISKQFNSWRLYHEKRKVKLRKRELAENHNKQKKCRIVLENWRALVGEQRHIYAHTEEKYQQKCSSLKRWALSVWQRNVQQSIREKQSAYMAELHHHRALVSKVLKTWHRFSAIHAYKKSETRQMVEQAQQSLHTAKLKRSFVKWRLARDEALLMNLKQQQAREHHNSVVCVRVLHTWTTFTTLSRRKKLLHGQSEWLRRSMLQARFLLTWKRQFTVSQTIQAQTNTALWHWCLTLQRKVLVSWWSYTETRRRKEERVREAYERRRQRLVKHGAGQWLKLAQQLTHIRAKCAAQLHSKTAYDTYQLVQKYALHWKHLAAKGRQRRGESTEKLHQPSSSFSRPVPSVRSNTTSVLLPKLSLSPARTTSHLADESGCPTVARWTAAQHNGVVSPVANRPVRPKPRQPSFLVESLKREGLYVHGPQLTQSDSSSPELREREEPNVVGMYQPCLAGGETFAIARTDSLTLQHRDERAGDAPSVRVISPHVQSTADLSSTCGTGKVDAGEFVPKEIQPKLISYEPTLTQIESGLPPDFVRSTNIVDDLPPFPDNSVPSEMREPAGHPVTLLTPSAFLMKKDGTPIEESQVDRANHGVTSKYLGQADPVKQSDGLTEFSGNVQGQGRRADSFLKSVALCEQDVSLQRQREIVHIRNRLRQFDEQKKKLRSLKSQWKQLSDWLAEQENQDEGPEDGDVLMMREEMAKMQEEMSAVRGEISRQRPECQVMVTRVQHLIQLQQLNTAV